MHRRENVYFWNHVRYAVVAIAVLPIVFMTASNVLAHEASPGAHQHIDGDPLDIIAFDTGQMELWFDDVYQYFGYYAWGSVLIFNNGELVEKYSDE
ncbi:MAG TPA: hypothetical protein PLA18_13650, partial [Deltaproteobacteria bacterium]|nr:hypothetical protein [Deltaproteobacteria bacterium]